MVDLGSPEHSVLREKVVEHIFLAELSRSLLLDLKAPFEVLRSEFDAFGYDVVIEANGVVRHIQLKTTVTAGARASVDVQLALAEKPSGCVVWMFVDPRSLELGPFLWLGGAPGQRLPPLGDRAVRHTRGTKGVRPGLRRVPRGMFTRVATVGELAMAMFGSPTTGHDRVLVAHLAARGESLRSVPVRVPFDFDASTDLAYMIEGYALAEEAGLGDAFAFADRMRAEAEREGAWRGTTLELWVALFMEHRRDRWQSQGVIGLPEIELPRLPLLDELAGTLAGRLAG